MASQSRSWVTHQTGNGGWYCLWEKPVPRIEDRIVDCSVYFYHSESAAKEGRGYGGSGFLVHVPSKVAGYVHLYAVTNKHIIDGNCGVLRLNTKTRGVEIINTKLEDWFVHPSGEDVAVRPLQLGETFRWWSVGTDMFITPEAIDAYRIGYGDEAFLVGRLVTHDGRQRNAPAVRFGYVSLMADPSEPIKTKGREQEGFLVDCRSLRGVSGSPVFVTTTQVYRGDDADKVAKFQQGKIRGTVQDSVTHFHGDGEISFANPNSKVTMLDISQAGPWLLGIDWGHLPLWNSVYERDKETKTHYQVEANTGVACVLPAWRIMDVLNLEVLVKERNQHDREVTKRIATEGAATFGVAQ